MVRNCICFCINVLLELWEDILRDTIILPTKYEDQARWRVKMQVKIPHEMCGIE